jgi:HemY protein
MEVLRVTWTRQPHPDLAEAYLTTSLYPTVRASRVEALVGAAPEHAESHLLRARAALEFGDLPASRRFAEAALAAGLEQRRVWLLLAEIAERSGDNIAASQALHRAATAVDSQWRCEACSTTYTAWHPACGQCGTVGQITWGEPGSQTVRLQVTAGDAILP